MIGFIWFIRWNNPYTEPKYGKHVLAEFYYDADDDTARQKIPDEVNRYYDENDLKGSGYGIHWKPISAPSRKQLSQEKLGEVRKKRLKRRIEKKYPLFSEQFIEEEIKKKESYYDGITDEELLRKRMEVMKEEEEHFYELNRNRIIIYWEKE